MAEAVQFPRLRGRVERAAPLAARSWFRAGGSAEWLVQPEDADDLLHLLRELGAGAPVTVIGAASNLIIRDGGIAGYVIRLPGRGFGAVARDGDALLAGAAALSATVAEAALAQGLSGVEFLCGIPGRIGGAVAMNAGAYGGETADILDWAEVATPHGLLRLTAQELRLAYRHAELPPGGVVARARLRATPGDPLAIAAKMRDIRAAREATQPIRERTGGSTFANPPGHKAWRLIDAAGCRGLAWHGAQVSPLHCNFLLNTGTATADDLESLGEAVQARVLAHSGIALRWEIQRVGRRVPRRASPA